MKSDLFNLFVVCLVKAGFGCKNEPPFSPDPGIAFFNDLADLFLISDRFRFFWKIVTSFSLN
jgi:hypothetical protein